MPLYNSEDRRILKEKMLQSEEQRVTISFYHYFHLEDPAAFRDELYRSWETLGVLGRIYVAYEGINAQISVPQDKLEEFRDHLYSYDPLNGIRLNIAIDDNGKSFFKLKIKVREKILADGLNDDTFDVTKCGEHVNAEKFNELIARDDAVLIDMRNHYETEVGHFEGAIVPDVDTFRDSLPVIEHILEDNKDQHLVMYCTGGIRCEKASAWFKHKGFKNVYQLNGGIIEYARQVTSKSLENKFHGKNFVFDERLGERISDEIISVCHQCGKPSDTHTNCLNEACHLLFIQCEDCTQQHENCCSDECQERNALPIEVQREMRKGKKSEFNIYKKGRSEKLPFGPRPVKNEVLSE